LTAGVAADLVKRSRLPDEDLGELWDLAVTAQASSSLGCNEYREGFMSKIEFFVLLSELQERMVVSTKQLVADLGLDPMPTGRPNPFKSQQFTKVPSISRLRSPSPYQYEEKEVVRENTTPPAADPPSLQALLTSLRDISEKGSVSEYDMSSTASVDSRDPTDSALLQQKVALMALDDSYDNKIAVEISELLTKSSQPPLPVDLLGLHTVSSHSTPNIVTKTDRPAALKPKFSISQLKMSRSNTGVSMDSPSDTAPQLAVRSIGPDSPNLTSAGFSPAQWLHNPTQTTAVHELKATDESDRKAIVMLDNLKNEVAKGLHKPVYGKVTKLSSVTSSFKKIRLGSKNESKASSYPDFIAAELLEKAALQGNVQLMASLLKYGADVRWGSVEFQKPHNALRMAATHGHTQAVDFLASRGALPEQIDAALFQSMTHGHMDIAINLMEKYEADIYLNSAPHMTYPVPNGQQVFRSFSGVAPSCFEAVGFCASAAGRARLLDSLLANKSFQPDVVASFRYIKDIECCVALTALAVFTSIRWTEGMKQLLSLGANANSVRTNAGKTDYAKHTMVEGYKFYHFEDTVPPICFISQEDWTNSPTESLAIAELLFQHGARAEIDTTNPFKKRLVPPIFRTIRAGNTAATKLYLANGADPDVTYDLGDLQVCTPLQLATQLGHMEIVRALIDAGAQVHRNEHGSRTPLWIACHLGLDTIVALLLRHDAHKTGTGVDECLKVAVRNVNASIVRQLLDEGAGRNLSVLSDALDMPQNHQRKDGYIEMLDVLTMHDAEVNGKHILLAINADNYIGLERVLTRATELGALAAGVQTETFAVGSEMNKRTYVSYARSRELQNFVRLLQWHGFKDE
jgi:ankyrin repeat protein